MTHEDAGHYSAKHASGEKPDPRIAQEIEGKALDGSITCAAAHEIAGELGVSSAEVGIAIDLLEIRIRRCQLGLFGYSPQKKVVKPAQSIAPELAKAIRDTLVHDRIPCLACWEIAEQFGMARIDVAAACEALEVKISSCQLGSFR
jgi:hypothetical protein